MELGEALARGLRGHDVDVMFGVMGDANMYFADAFHKLQGTRFVASANESGAVLMAAGYAAVSGRLGVATVTHGAIANCVSALFDAARGRYPLLLVAGDTARSGGYHLQNIPQREVVAPTGAAYREVRSPETALTDLAAAVQQALADRRPVVLELPVDFQEADAPTTPVRVPAIFPGVLEPSREAMEEAASVIIGANRPLLLAGRGAATADVDSLRKLAERIGAPVATTLRGKGLFAGDPWDLGICGTLADPVASEVVANSDCIVAFGTSLSALTTLKGELLAGKRVVQIDTDPAAIGRYYPVDVAVMGDATVAAQSLTALMDEADAPAAAFRSEELADRLAAWAEQDRAPRTAASPLDLTGVMHRLNALVPPPRTLTVDGGRFCHEALRILQVADPTHYAHCLNVGHIGMSIGYGIGAATARPDLPALTVVGDGGFMLGGLTEFNTAVRHQTSMVICLINDGAYGAEYYRFVGKGLDPALTTFDWPGFAEIANALGGTGIRVEEWADFDRVGEAITTNAGPVLVEVILDRDDVPDPGEH
jgi:acetolactate synthase I/II/III large subunit